MKPIIVYMTWPNKDDALHSGRSLVKKKLVACCNIKDTVTSIYSWKEEVCEDTEVTMIAKTTEEKFDSLMEYVKKNHEYSVPCILKIPIEGGNPEYLEWLYSSVSNPSE